MSLGRRPPTANGNCALPECMGHLLEMDQHKRSVRTLRPRDSLWIVRIGEKSGNLEKASDPLNDSVMELWVCFIEQGLLETTHHQLTSSVGDTHPLRAIAS